VVVFGGLKDFDAIIAQQCVILATPQYTAIKDWTTRISILVPREKDLYLIVIPCRNATMAFVSAGSNTAIGINGVEGFES